MLSFLSAFFAVAASVATASTAVKLVNSAKVTKTVAVDPTQLEFKLLSSRRFMLDNELVLSEFVPGSV
ncbi:MAG: hypothetical protein IKJ37_02425, partial [Kiritimatiellae bacterium]|nr:hypothetical protein [Kiritimatiellia bacterium]